MIPKTIHYVWFGGKPLGELEQKCIESWKKHLPDYEIIRWDESTFDVKQNAYCHEAFLSKKWAFVSDYVRLWALVNFGGIYMDTDVEVLRPLDSFLSLRAFSGFESETMVPTGIMAAEAGHELFRELLAYYDDKHFVLEDGSIDQTTNVTIFTDCLRSRGLRQDNSLQDVSGLTLFPRDYFCPKSHSTGKINLTKNSVTIHHFNGSWVDADSREINEMKRRMVQRVPFLPSKIAGLISCFLFSIRHGDLSLLKRYFSRFLAEREKRISK